MAAGKKLLLIAALVLLSIVICNSTKCYNNENFGFTCDEATLNNSIIDCPGLCRRRISGNSQKLSCSKKGEGEGCVSEENKQEESKSRTCVCTEDLCNMCVPSAGICVGSLGFMVTAILGMLFAV